jgi:hypothetical protein
MKKKQMNIREGNKANTLHHAKKGTSQTRPGYRIYLLLSLPFLLLIDILPQIQPIANVSHSESLEEKGEGDSRQAPRAALHLVSIDTN